MATMNMPSYESEADTPSYRYRGFHKTGYQQPAVTLTQGNPLEKDNRKVRRFHGPGVELHADPQRFAYGSDASYEANGIGRQRFAIGFNKTSAERRKLRRQYQEAEADIQAHQESKLKHHQEKVVEKRKDLEMLQKHQPWGRPAAGAPRVTPSGGIAARRQRFDFAESTTSDGGGGKYNPFGRPGAGAPIRTDSGQMVTSLRADPDTRFQTQLRREVEHSMRYKDPSSQERWQQRDQTIQRTESEKVRLMEKREEKLRYARRLEEQRIEAMERKAREKEEKKAAGPVYFPWGSSKPERDESGKIRGRRWILGRDENANPDKKSGGLVFQLGKQGLGAGSIKSRVSNVDTTTGQSRDLYNPWGRPGAGAPLRGRAGELVTEVYGKCYSEKMGTNEPLVKVIQHSQEEKQKETGRKLKGEGIDVASWLRAGVVGQPKRNLVTGEIVGGSKSTSDVTTDRFEVRQHPTTTNSQKYFTDLQQQAEQRQRKLREQRQAERRLEQQHAERVDQLWGEERKSSHPLRASWERQSAAKDDPQSLRKKEYCEELQKMIEERREQRKRSRERAFERERKHMEAFDQQWGRPGAGAPRVNEYGQIDATPKSFNSLLETQVHTGWHFRRT